MPGRRKTQIHWMGGEQNMARMFFLPSPHSVPEQISTNWKTKPKAFSRKSLLAASETGMPLLRGHTEVTTAGSMSHHHLYAFLLQRQGAYNLCSAHRLCPLTQLPWAVGLSLALH